MTDTKIPGTVDAWAELLFSAYLTVGPDDDASDIYSFEVTLPVLSRLCGLPEASAEVDCALRDAALSDGQLHRALREGLSLASLDTSPKLFFYLAMSLYVDSLLGGEYSSQGAFRAKLSQWLRVDHSFSNLLGIARMWERLAVWLERRATREASLRKLRLPEIPPNWTHIGYTRRFSFPTRSDIRLMREITSSEPDSLLYPRRLIDLTQLALQSDRGSWGLRDALTSFRDAFLSEKRSLADHRFWRLAQQSALPSDRATPYLCLVELSLDEDGERSFLAASSREGQRFEYRDLSLALEAANAKYSANLASAVRRGVLLFISTGIGRWEAVERPSFAPGGVHFAIDQKYLPTLSLSFSFVESGGWLLSARPYELSVVAESLTRAKAWRADTESIYPVSLRDGIRVGRGWLGRPNFLPLIDGDSECSIRPEDNQGNDTSLRVVGHTLSSMAAVDGVFRLEANWTKKSSADWSIRISFSSRAIPRNEHSNAARFELTPLSDWIDGCETPRVRRIQQLKWEEGTPNCVDLLEALYAAGSSGWDEADIVGLIRRAGSSHSPWSLLRTLSDAGWLQPRLRKGWRGRVWTLVPPRLKTLLTPQGRVCLLEGAVCEQQLDEFLKAATSTGARPFRRLGISTWSPITYGFVDGDCDKVSEKMGWKTPAVALEPKRGLSQLSTTLRRGDGYVEGTKWSWAKRLFSHTSNEWSRCSLERMVHPDRADHDIYVVRKGKIEKHFLARTAAIVELFHLARLPLFKWNGHSLVRLAEDGGMPDRVAQILRRQMIRTAGPTEAGYAYPADQVTAELARRFLGEIVASNDGIHQSAASAVRARLRGYRVAWSEGRLRVASELQDVH